MLLSSACTGNDLSASTQLLPVIRAGGDDSRSATKRFSFIPFFFVISVIAAIKFGFRASKARLCVWTDATRSRFVLICRQIFMEHMPDVAAVCHSTVTPRQAFKNTPPPFDLSFFLFNSSPGPFKKKFNNLSYHLFLSVSGKPTDRKTDSQTVGG